MNYVLITVPIAVLCFFLGFYLQLLIKILVDILSGLGRLRFTAETQLQQEQLSKGASTTFVEPQDLAEMLADEELERIKALNDNKNLSDL